MTVATDEDRGPGPVPPPHSEETHQDHGVFSPRGARARAQTGGHQGVGGPLENEERQRAITPIVVVIERECLLPMGLVIGVIEVEHNGGRWLGGAGDAVVDQGVGEAVEVLAVDAVFQTCKGGGTRPILRRVQGRPLHTALEHGVVPETLGIMAVRIPGGDLIETLGQEVPERVVDRGRMSLVLHSRGKAFGEANLAIDAT